MGKSALIKIGGRTSQEIENRKFLIEDAIFACQSALNYGVVCGGSLVIPKLIHKKKAEIIERMDLSHKSELEIAELVLELISNAFQNVFKTVIRHVSSDVNMERTLSEDNIPSSIVEAGKEDFIDAVVEYCVTSDQMFDAKRFVFEDEDTTRVINSSETDIEVLRGTSSIIGMLAASDQFVSGR